MLCYHALLGAAAATAAAGQPRLIGARVQSRAISHPEQFTYRPQPSKVPSLRRGWILGPKRDTSVAGLEILLPSPDQEQEVEHKWIFPQADQCRKTGKEEREDFLGVGSDESVKSAKNGNERYDGLLEEDENKDEVDEQPILTKPKYVRGPDIAKRSFIRIYSISALRIPVAECWDLVSNLREHLLNWPRVSNIGRVAGDDVDKDLATFFVETSDRKQSVTRYDVRAAVYADAETGISRKKLAVDNDNRKGSSKQEVLSCREAAFMLELEEEAEHEFEQEDGISTDVPNLNWSTKWTGPTRLLLLDEKYAGKEVSELPAPLQAVYSRFGHLAPKSGLVSCRLTIFYEYWSMEEVLRELLPEEAHEPVKFYRAGHVAELKLHPEHLPFRHLIAQVMLDKYKPTVRSVVVKRDRVDAKGYAVQLELLAGTTSLVTTAWENDIPFRIDIASANWDPRLRSEWQRLVNSFSRSDVVYYSLDAMVKAVLKMYDSSMVEGMEECCFLDIVWGDLCAGVGLLAIPASKKVRRVYANEVNSHAHFYLASNVVDNQASGKIEVFNEDIQTFLRKVFYIERPLPITQLVMSHPLTTGEFLELLQGAFSRKTWPNASLPRIHLYGISRGIDPAETFSKEIAGVLQTTDCKIFTSRVAKMTGGEWVVSASFNLPAHFGFS